MSDRAYTWPHSSIKAAMVAIHSIVLVFIFHGVLVNNHQVVMWFYGYTRKSKLLLLVIDINTVEKVSFLTNSTTFF
jgi:hypothetical protein